jgi:hypothetical protein
MAESKTIPHIESNLMVDVAAFLFLEDIADKQGASGMNTYLMSLASSLAKSMPEEAHETWDDFTQSLERGNSILSTFEDVFLPTKNCVVTRICPFDRAWNEYTQRIGEISRIHYDVADYYNSTVYPGAVDSMCIIHQTFRRVAASRIKVAGKPVQLAQIAAVVFDGKKKITPEHWLPIVLEKAGVTKTELNMLLRNNACVWAIY